MGITYVKPSTEANQARQAASKLFEERPQALRKRDAVPFSQRPGRCDGCPFSGRTACPRGNPESPVCIVGESPGREELKDGIPFVGPSGEILWNTVPEKIVLPGGRVIMLREDEAFITNALCCSPKADKKQNLLQHGVMACRARLLEEVNEHPREIVIALGNGAMWGLTGDTSLRITQDRGQLLDTPAVNSRLGVLPILHPAALLRGGGSYRQFKEDIFYGCELASGTRTPNDSVEVGSVYWTLLNTPQKVRKVVRKIRRRAATAGVLHLGADCETTGLERTHQDELLSLGIAYDPRHVYIIPEHLCTPELLNELADDHRVRWIWHNGKFDIFFMRRLGIRTRVDEDTMLLSYTQDETPGVHGLETVGRDVFRAPDWKFMIKPYLPNKKTSYAVIPKPILYEYQSKDVSLTLRIHQTYLNRVNNDKDSKLLYHRMLIPASEMLYRVEKTGMYVDQEWMEGNGERLQVEIEEASKEFCDLVGRNVNLNSPIQLREVLYGDLKVQHHPASKLNRAEKNKADALDFTTAKEVLERKLSDTHGAIKILRHHRKLAKQYGTYVKGVGAQIGPDGCVHTVYKIHGSQTGRLSSSEPNVQNIPRDPQIRGQFVAPPGCSMIEIDQSQSELRCLAAMSGDPLLCDIYTSTDRSLHKEVALEMYGEGYDKDQYVRAKAVNFGIIYGREADSIKDEFSIARAEAQRLIDVWFETFPVARETLLMFRKAPGQGKVLKTVFGRRKRFGVVSRKQLKELQNQAANFPIQSLSTDIVLDAAMRVYLEHHPQALPFMLWAMGCYITNLVHDSTLVISPHEDPKCDFNLDVARLVKHSMETTPLLWGVDRVPFKADISVGHRWGHLEELEGV